jgi:PhnB protein
LGLPKEKEVTPMVKKIPDGYHSVTPYLVVSDAEAVLNFTMKAFGATEKVRMPGPDGRVAHAEVTIGDSVIMLGSPQPGQPLMPAMIYLYVEDTDGTYKKALGAGGKSLEEPNDAFYGDRRAAVEDSQGNQWYIATHQEDPTPEQMQERMDAMAKQMQGAEAS